MKYKYSLTTGKKTGHIGKFPVSTSALAAGAVTMRGTTVATTMGTAIVTTTGVDVVGVTSGATTPGVYATGTAFNESFLQDLHVGPDSVFEATYDLTDTGPIISSSGTAVTVAAGNEVISGWWMYIVAGTGAGQLRFVIDCADQAITTLTAFSPVLDATSTYIKILPYYALLCKLSSNGTLLGTDAAAGAVNVSVKRSFIFSQKRGKELLVPNKHNGLSGLNTTSLRTSFMSEIVFRDHIDNPLS